MNTDRFLEIKRMLTPSQWKLLKAVAKEGEVQKPTSAAFLSKYGLASGPAVLKSLKSLIEKELILETVTLEGSVYSVYNVFFSRYLEYL
jgi:DNA-binding MarR family transcriptional regulator